MPLLIVAWIGFPRFAKPDIELIATALGLWPGGTAWSSTTAIRSGPTDRYGAIGANGPQNLIGVNQPPLRASSRSGGNGRADAKRQCATLRLDPDVFSTSSSRNRAAMDNLPSENLCAAPAIGHGLPEFQRPPVEHKKA
jgi:hypothetical protein